MLMLLPVVDQLKTHGPGRHISCIRQEAKHNLIKQKKWYNYKNLSYSVRERAGDFILKQEEKITILFIEEIVLKSGKISFFSVHDDGDRAATPGKQTMKEILFSKFKLPTFSSQVMPYLNGDDLGGTERKT
ncbi:hypothetical protein Avbf_14044 [Armadillidium vulgare]|nr:hypothetical protein Avbf_14044 [Armadillidium vulgare]